MKVERELKFHLRARAPARMAAAAADTRTVASVYYDTHDQALRRAGMALRLRRDGDTWLQTLKFEKAASGGLSERREWEVPARGQKLDLEAFPCGEIAAATGTDLARLGRRLRPLFETVFTRRSGVVRLAGAGRAEVAIDHGAIVAGPRCLPIWELELELKSGTAPALLRFAETLRLPLAYESKAERGYRLAAGRTRPALRTWRMPPVARDAQASEVFAVLFRLALEQAGANASGALQSGASEYVRQAQSGLRRMRSLLAAFDPVLTNPESVRGSLHRLLRRLETAPQKARAVLASAALSTLILRALRWLETMPAPPSSDFRDLKKAIPSRLETLGVARPGRVSAKAAAGRRARR